MSNKTLKKKVVYLLGILLGLGVGNLFVPVTQAAVIMEKSRVIFQEESAEESLLLINNGNQPVIVQSWIDNGDIDSVPDKVISPFVVIPPVFKMQPNEFTTLRILYSGDTLPADKESMYWLNIYEVPPVASEDLNEAAKVNLALRTQMKVFYRPKGISPRTEKSGTVIRFSVERDRLMINNPTSYFQSIVGLTVCGEIYSLAGALAPVSTTYVFAPSSEQCKITNQINYILIDDNGNEEIHKQSLN